MIAGVYLSVASSAGLCRKLWADFSENFRGGQTWLNLVGA